MIHPHSVRAMCAAIAKDVADEYANAFMGARSFSVANCAHIDLGNLPIETDWTIQLRHAIAYLNRDRIQYGTDFNEAFKAAQVNAPLEQIEERIRLYYSRYKWEET
jgi:hypothetical protein